MSEGDSPRPSPLSGTTLGRYMLERLLGEGGMGVVYAARHQDLGRRAAVKILNERYAESDQVRVRFLREGQSASRIRHPNIVDVYDVGTQDGRAYLVMELLEGEDLRSLISREGPLSPRRTADLLVPVVSALAAAHDTGVVHRDLKPDNVFLSRERNSVAPKVLDFGISKVVDDEKEASLTGTGALLGTPYYMSPEQAQGAKDIDARTDQYSVGVMLYECLTGRRPVEEPSIYHLISRIVRGDFAPPRQLVPEIPAAFEQLILTAMASKPEDRFSNTRALGRALLAFAGERVRGNYAGDLASDETTAPIAPSPQSGQVPEMGTTLRESVHERDSTRRPAARRSAGTLAAGAALLGSVLGGVLWLGSRSVSPEPAAAAPPPHGAAEPPSATAAPAVPATSRRTIVTEPPGASVFVGGAEVGVTPLAVEVPGDVELVLADFETAKRTVSTSDPEEVVVKLVRKPAPQKPPAGSRPKPIGLPKPPPLAPR